MNTGLNIGVFCTLKTGACENPLLWEMKHLEKDCVDEIQININKPE